LSLGAARQRLLASRGPGQELLEPPDDVSAAWPAAAARRPADPHAPALPPTATGAIMAAGAGDAATTTTTTTKAPGAPPGGGGGGGGEGDAPAPPAIRLDDALYAEAYAAAFPFPPPRRPGDGDGDDDGADGARRRRRRRHPPRPNRHLHQRRLAQARLAEGLPPAALAGLDEEGPSSSAAPAPPLLSAAVAVRAIAGGRHPAGGSGGDALPPPSAVAVATFVTSEAQLEFALNWAAGLDAAGVDGGEEGEGGGGAAATGYLAVAATPELAARLADAGIPSAVFPTPEQARAARAEWEEAAAAAAASGRRRRRPIREGEDGEDDGDGDALRRRERIADVPTPLVAAEAAARGHPRVALARALLEFGFRSALVTDPDVAWAAADAADAAGGGRAEGGKEEKEALPPPPPPDPRDFLAAAARAAGADALVGSNTLSPGAGRAGLADGGLDVPTTLLLGSSGVAELVHGAAGAGGAPPSSSSSSSSSSPSVAAFLGLPGGLANRNQTNAAASAAFGASRRLTDGLLDPGVLFLRRTPATVAFADAWCSVMAGRGEAGAAGVGSGGSGSGASPPPPPPPPVDSHAFNRLALDGWEPRFLPAAGTWSALNATATAASDASAPPTLLLPPSASTDVPPAERALVGWRGGLRLGVLPLAAFPNGHAHFVQRLHDMAVAEKSAATPPPPLFAVRPGTHLFGGAAGKRHRLRDAGLWRLDGPEYFFGWGDAARDPLAADGRAREEATLRREREARERAAELERARDAAAARAAALAVAAGAGRGMGAGEVAAKFFRPFTASWPTAARFAAIGGGGGVEAPGGDGAAPRRQQKQEQKPHRQKYVAFALPLAPDLPSAEFEALPGGAEEMSGYHAAGLALQREQLMAMVGVALALDRALVLPRFRCYCDRHWTMLHRCRVPGAGLTPLPFACPQDHVAEPGKFAESGLLGEAAPLDVREAAFLERARPQGAAGPRVLDVAPTEGLDAPREEWGVWRPVAGGRLECRRDGDAKEEEEEQEEGGGTAAPPPQPKQQQQQQQQRCLRRVLLPLDTAQGVLRAHLQPYADTYDVLRFSTPLRVLRSFDAPERAASAARRIAHLRGSDTGAGLPRSATAAAAARRRRREKAEAAAKAT
jgi:hypothetical protein